MRTIEHRKIMGDDWETIDGRQLQSPEKSHLVETIDSGKPREGRWCAEEIMYADVLIDSFKKGLLNLVAGTSLRTHLSQVLSW